MKVAIDYTKYLNPAEVVVGVSDAPLFSLKRFIQMSYPEQFEGYFCFMGGLHIEQAALICMGQLIKGSGLDDIKKGHIQTSSGCTSSHEKTQWCFDYHIIRSFREANIDLLVASL